MGDNEPHPYYTPTHADHKSEVRIARLETTTQELSQSLNRFAHSVEKSIAGMREELSTDRRTFQTELRSIAERQASGKSVNWSAVSVGLGVFALIASFAGYAIMTNESRIERLEAHHEKEVDRNNKLEHFAGREEMLTELYMSGMLKNPAP